MSNATNSTLTTELITTAAGTYAGMVAVGLVGLFINYGYLVADGKKPAKLALFLARAVWVMATRTLSPFDVFTDAVFASDLDKRGHPNYSAVATFIVCLPFLAMWGLVGYVFVQKYKDTTSRAVWLIPFWLLCGLPFVVLTELFLFSYLLLVPDL